MRLRLHQLLQLALIALSLVSAQSALAAASCDAILQKFPQAAAGIKIEFVRPVVVSRGELAEGMRVLDLVTDAKVDGQILCKDDQFVRFTARIGASADANLRDVFFRIQQAAVVSIIGWPARRAAATLHGMTAEVADFLRASIERGDIELAGKTEEHAGMAGDIGMIWTRTEREFVVVAAE
jgi:hypothetical protein